MFTGIVQEIGTIVGVENAGGGQRMTIEAPASARELHVSDSVAVNGVCQTVIAKSVSTFYVEAVEETLKKTTFSRMRRGSRLNLELPVRLSDRLGGHLVLGHVDTVGVVHACEERERSRLITIEYPVEFSKYVIPVGSIAVDGVSLTIASVRAHSFEVSVIPHTLTKTTLDERAVGDEVNLEFDVVGKYVERLISSRGISELTWEKLRSWGFDA